MTVLSIHLLLFVSLVASMPVAGQDLPSFATKAKSIVEAKDSKLKLVLRDEREKEHFYIWRIGDGPNATGIWLRVFYGASTKEAIERMRSALDNLSQVPDIALKGLGDEAYIATDSSATSVWFRKSNVYVYVVAPSVEMAEDIAKKVAELVPDQRQSDGLDPRIPLANPQLYKSVRDAKDWRNPFLVVLRDGVRMISPAINGGEKTITLGELRDSLKKLPVSSWPYGRVVGWQENSIGSGDDTQILRKNAGTVLEILESMGIGGFGFPSG